jgi:hypothetical protein
VNCSNLVRRGGSAYCYTSTEEVFKANALNLEGRETMNQSEVTFERLMKNERDVVYEFVL